MGISLFSICLGMSQFSDSIPLDKNLKVDRNSKQRNSKIGLFPRKVFTQDFNST